MNTLAKNSRKNAQKSQKFNRFLFLQFLGFLCLFVANSAFAYSGGNGSPENPYQIADVNDLLQLAADDPNYSKCFILTNDINLASYTFDNALIAPNPLLGFSGNFDGACHYITNLTINVEDVLFGYVYIGLFGNTGYSSEISEIKNLYLNNIRINVDDSDPIVGSLIGYNNGITINNCHANVLITGDSIGSSYLGGIAGQNIGTINNCSSEGTIFISSVAGDHGSLCVGGLVGDNRDSMIINSHSHCNIHCTFNNYINSGAIYRIGGLVGTNWSDYYISSIINCHSTGTIEGYNSNIISYLFIGGLVGDNFINGFSVYKANIYKCFSTSNVTAIVDGVKSIGGLVGHNYGDINDCFSSGSANGPIMDEYQFTGLGGLVGYNEPTATIRHCYSSGDVNAGPGSINVGGLVGKHYESDINNSYFLNTSGPDNLLGEPLTDSQMKQQASFVGWDFIGESINGSEDVWWILENSTYPKLNWMRIPPDYGDCGSGPGGGDDDGGLYFPDYNFDNFINFFDFAIFADYWLIENPFISLDTDTDVDIYDLKIFCNDWLESASE